MENQGQLTIRVTAHNFALPVAEAKITITDENGNPVESLITNINGVTPTITLPAPSPTAQQNPELPVRPYSKYNVDVKVDGYLEALIKGVQIYGESHSELPVDLEAPEPATIGKINVYDIGENALLLPDTHMDIPPAEPIIHGEVFIPTHITVHLGTPSSNARNVSVRFVDYVKNVASSEIFPDWPYHALRANIHAQISLTLNRIYTEWYRSKGYNFDITNSTQYDQYFIEGRNIFDSVSVIADEIFNTYVIKPPGTEPYFTEYCNGTTATCPGLKQWGTVTLANQGRNYLDILRYYYGSTIYVQTTDNIKSPFESFPGTLSQGSTGANVAILQAQLNRIRRNYPAMPLIAPQDGVYGTQTAAAVRKFQEIFGLSQTGVTDRATWYKISYIYAAVLKLAELGSEGQPAPPTTPEPETPPPSGGQEFPGTLLKSGSRGDDVALMQRYLNALSERYPSIPRQTVDGIFGNNMLNAVLAFQRLFGLTADGIIGRITWDRIVTEYNNLPATPPSTVEPAFPGYNIKQGQRSDNVLLLQKRLNTLSRYYPDIPRQSEDGIFGPLMNAAVTTFQKLYNLTADGIVGRNTWNQIMTVYNNLPTTPTDAFPGTLLTAGMQNDHIKLMQNYLNAIGKVYTQIPQIEAVGLFGPMTQLAVLTFQRIFGLTADGIIGRITWEAIVREYHELFD